MTAGAHVCSVLLSDSLPTVRVTLAGVRLSSSCGSYYLFEARLLWGTTRGSVASSELQMLALLTVRTDRPSAPLRLKPDHGKHGLRLSDMAFLEKLRSGR